ncbi:MAG TPA: leucyl aminopeptidase family protein [Acetobacteraceae bacterium]|nr:leucyl aminopeptidase family protein [Acetobacteraceae bacterium]
MFELGCVVDRDDNARPLFPVRPPELASLLDRLPAAQTGYLRDLGFTAKSGEVGFLPGPNGVAGAVCGLGDNCSPFAFGHLARLLPEATTWRLEPGDYDAGSATLGFCLGAYRYTALKAADRAPARLVVPAEHAEALSQARAICMARDLINTPANLLGPVELADFAIALGRGFGAKTQLIEGEALERDYPAVAAVGAGSPRPSRVAIFRWRGSAAHDEAPLISLCGKGVCFDTGGLDLKPAGGMLHMKKDMGGAANVLALAQLLMQADLPVRLAVRIGCVENAVSGTAMRPRDVIRTRSGLTVEIGNTDAEGRLVLCDLLADAGTERPALLIDFATLTGAARVALGPDLPALFCNDDAWAEQALRAGRACHDPVWRMPLWDGYNTWLDSPVADLNNISSKPFAGAIVAALFLRRFIPKDTAWLHLDLYAWNEQTQAGRPEGGEAQAVRGVFAAIKERLTAAG